MGRLSDHNIVDLKQKYNINTFIETGTFKGFGIKFIQNINFDKIYSCEFLKQWRDYCVQKFKDDARVKIFNSESQVFLKKILNNLESTDKCIFWLDAHYPGKDPYYQKSLDNGIKIDYGSYDFDVSNILLPLKEELKIIKKYRNNNKDIIIVDDARVYTDCICEKGSCGNEIPLPKDRSMNWYKELFKETHTFSYDPRAGGYFIYIPKE